MLKPHLFHHDHFVHDLLDMTGMAEERGWLSTESHPIYLIIVLILSSSYLLLNIYMGHTYCLFGEIYAHSSSPDVFSHQFSNHAISKSLTIQLVHWLQPMHQWKTVHLAISPFKQTVWPCVLPNILPTLKISLLQYLSGLPQKGVIMLKLLAGAWIMCWTIS